ncbi:hypothetical protein KIPB_004745, partial [Kipferlia bialata]
VQFHLQSQQTLREMSIHRKKKTSLPLLKETKARADDLFHASVPDKAAAVYEDAAGVAAKLYGTDTYHVAHLLASASLAHVCAHHFSASRRLSGQALRLYSQTKGKDTRMHRAKLLHTRGLAQAAQGMFSEADVDLGQALSLFLQVYPPEHPSAVVCLANRGVVTLAKWGETQAAAKKRSPGTKRPVKSMVSTELNKACKILREVLHRVTSQYPTRRHSHIRALASVALGLAQLLSGDYVPCLSTVREELGKGRSIPASPHASGGPVARAGVHEVADWVTTSLLHIEVQAMRGLNNHGSAVPKAQSLVNRLHASPASHSFYANHARAMHCSSLLYLGESLSACRKEREGADALRRGIEEGQAMLGESRDTPLSSTPCRRPLLLLTEAASTLPLFPGVADPLVHALCCYNIKGAVNRGRAQLTRLQRVGAACDAVSESLLIQRTMPLHSVGGGVAIKGERERERVAGTLNHADLDRVPSVEYGSPSRSQVYREEEERERVVLNEEGALDLAASGALSSFVSPVSRPQAPSPAGTTTLVPRHRAPDYLPTSHTARPFLVRAPLSASTRYGGIKYAGASTVPAMLVTAGASAPDSSLDRITRGTRASDASTPRSRGVRASAVFLSPSSPAMLGGGERERERERERARAMEGRETDRPRVNGAAVVHSPFSSNSLRVLMRRNTGVNKEVVAGTHLAQSSVTSRLGASRGGGMGESLVSSALAGSMHTARGVREQMERTQRLSDSVRFTVGERYGRSGVWQGETETRGEEGERGVGGDTLSLTDLSGRQRERDSDEREEREMKRERDLAEEEALMRETRAVLEGLRQTLVDTEGDVV